MNWSDETIKTSLQIRYACGKKGYELLRHVGYPLPAYRTLCNRMQDIPMRPGLQKDLIDFVFLKLKNFPDKDHDCVLSLDEVQVRKCIQYDKGLNSFIGYVSEEIYPKQLNDPTHQLATHVLVFMIRGISMRWKQVIGYFFTGDSVTGPTLWSLVKKTIILLGDKNMHVRAVVSDMGAANQAMWANAGITCTKFALRNSIEHPCNSDERLVFLADVPHLLKNIRNSLLVNNIVLPDDIVTKFGLPSNLVSFEPVKELVKLQTNSCLKLAPSLTKAHVTPGQYEKMRVSTAAQVLSHTTASALRFLVQCGQLEEKALTTAFFLDLVNEWFDVCNSRAYKSALFVTSEKKLLL